MLNNVMQYLTILFTETSLKRRVRNVKKDIKEKLGMLRKDDLLLIANNDTVNEWGSEGRIQGVIPNKLAGNVFI
jgi:hypothetical protein